MKRLSGDVLRMKYESASDEDALLCMIREITAYFVNTVCVVSSSQKAQRTAQIGMP